MTSDRCTFTTSDGRRCTLLVYSGHSSLCHQHLRKELEATPPSEDIAAGILSSIQNFQSATAINAAQCAGERDGSGRADRAVADCGRAYGAPAIINT